MKKFLLAVLLAVFAALAFAACGDDGGEGGDADSGDVTGDDAENGDGTGDDASGGNVITVTNFAFSGVSEVGVGDTVDVEVQEGTHTWTGDDGAFDSGSLGTGESFSFSFDEAGAYAYHCEIHPSMTGTITVS